LAFVSLAVLGGCTTANNMEEISNNIDAVADNMTV
jgi:hypothetical protein